MNPSRIGPFALEERLGGSLSASVYRAVHVQQRRSVALKVFAAPLVAQSPAAKALLVREVEILKRLQHPHIARCYGGILEASQGCIAYELVPGESLTSLLSRRGRLAWETVAEYAEQISSALEHAHQQGVVHQHLSPDKILITEDQKTKIADFRLDRARNPTCSSSHKRSLERLKYLAPEQVRGETALTPQVDLYALGCIMFEMLVGHGPFPAESLEELARHHLETPPPRVDSIIYDCPAWLDALVGQLLNKDPSHRPRGAGAVSAALRPTRDKLAGKAGPAPRAAGPLTAAAREARELLRRARREQAQVSAEQPSPFYEQAWFLALCLVLLAASVATWALWPVSDEKLFLRAKALMETNDEAQWREARDRYLQPLLKKFPQGPYAEEARAYLDQIDMAAAEARLKVKIRLGRAPSSEGERLFAEAWNYEQFGDRVTALEKYHSMVDLLSDGGEDRPYVNLARRQIAAIENEHSARDQTAFLRERLADADKLAAEGNVIEAGKIWRSIVKLYGNNQELSPLVQQAQLRLDGKPASESAKEPEASPTSPAP